MQPCCPALPSGLAQGLRHCGPSIGILDVELQFSWGGWGAHPRAADGPGQQFSSYRTAMGINEVWGQAQ